MTAEMYRPVSSFDINKHKNNWKMNRHCCITFIFLDPLKIHFLVYFRRLVHFVTCCCYQAHVKRSKSRKGENRKHSQK